MTMKAAILVALAFGASSVAANGHVQYKMLAGGYLRCGPGHGDWDPAGNSACIDIKLEDLPGGKVPTQEYIYSQRDKLYFHCQGLGKNQEFQCDQIDQKKVPADAMKSIAEPEPSPPTTTVAPQTTEASTSAEAIWSTVSNAGPTATWLTVLTDLTGTADPTATPFYASPEQWATAPSSTRTSLCTPLPSLPGGFPGQTWDSCGGTVNGESKVRIPDDIVRLPEENYHYAFAGIR